MDKKKDKYFLDVNYMLNHLSPNSVYATDAKEHEPGSAQSEQSSWRHKKYKNQKGIYSLTDLILTCEAIRRGDQKSLSRDGFRNSFFNFIYGNRETLVKYEKAILDNETSQMAIKNNLTHFDFLREHMFMMANLGSVSYEDKVRFAHIQREQFYEDRRKWREENKHLFEERDKKLETPF